MNRIRDTEHSKRSENFALQQESNYSSILSDITLFIVSGILALFFGIYSLKPDYYGGENGCVMLRKWTVPCFIFHCAYTGLITLFIILVILSFKCRMPIPLFKSIVYIIGLAGFLIFYIAIAIFWSASDYCGTLWNWVLTYIILGAIGLGLLIFLCFWIMLFMGIGPVLESFGFTKSRDSIKAENQIKEKKEEIKYNYTNIEEQAPI